MSTAFWRIVGGSRLSSGHFVQHVLGGQAHVVARDMFFGPVVHELVLALESLTLVSASGTHVPAPTPNIDFTITLLDTPWSSYVRAGSRRATVAARARASQLTKQARVAEKMPSGWRATTRRT